MFTKRQRRRDKSVVSDVKPFVRQSYHKSSIALSKVDDLTIDELLRGIEDLKSKLGKLKGKDQL